MDGLVQAIVCTNEINWARQARKIILVATDGHLHTAGDGKVRKSYHLINRDFGSYIHRKEHVSLS